MLTKERKNLVFIAINAVTLGTWSFSTQVQSVSLPERLLGMFLGAVIESRSILAIG